jgi:hypothetical protein
LSDEHSFSFQLPAEDAGCVIITTGSFIQKEGGATAWERGIGKQKEETGEGVVEKEGI